jgi:hypothetical protein
MDVCITRDDELFCDVSVRKSLSCPHSSACFYETGKQGVYEIRNLLELEGNSWII